MSGCTCTGSFVRSGQAFWSSSEMGTLNETAADIAGRELGDATFAQMGGDLEENALRYQPQEERDSRFTEMMRETRRGTEELLAEGRILEAEEYMKERWWRLRLGGYGIRKLNQAYFAFYGIYGESASSVSPIGDQMAEFRSYFDSVGEFVRALSGISSYDEFWSGWRGSAQRRPIPGFVRRSLLTEDERAYSREASPVFSAAPPPQICG